MYVIHVHSVKCPQLSVLLSCRTMVKLRTAKQEDTELLVALCLHNKADLPFQLGHCFSTMSRFCSKRLYVKGEVCLCCIFIAIFLCRADIFCKRERQFTKLKICCNFALKQNIICIFLSMMKKRDFLFCYKIVTVQSSIHRLV